MGKVYGDRWKNEGSVGEGGQARTFRVRDLSDGSTNWILKELKNRQRLGRFKREILVLEAINSPHIPKTEDYSVGDPAYHVSPALGIGLDKYAASNPLDVDHALDLFEQIVSAVRDAHKTGVVVHRDIKPNNVVISPDGTMAYLIDFGICQYSDGELTLLTTSEEPFGNAAFAAPECFLGREEEPGPACDVYSLGKLLYWMISGSHYISRERLSSTVVERIMTDNDLLRFYLMRLIRGTVVEDPAARWTASHLLEEVRETKELIGNVREYERRGEIILTDGFGVGDSFNQTSSRSATTKNPRYPPDHQVIHLGGPPGDQDIGTAFEVSVGHDVRLETISLALGHRAGEDELHIRIACDLEGKPDPNKELEVFWVPGSLSYSSGMVTLHSRTHPVLRQGHRYWILLSVRAPNSEIALWSAPLGFMPRPALLAERRDGGEWEVAESRGGPGYAIRVTGRPVSTE
jgi:serine/threonine protein kinase